MADGEVAGRLAQVRERVLAACGAAGRDPSDVALLLATKTQDVATIRAALVAAGDSPVLLGENRVQELVAKAPELADLSPTWHVIGPLQTNKVNAALRWSSCVESVGSIALARRLAERATRQLDVMVQINVSGEPTKHGVAPAAASELAHGVAELTGLRLVGFMTVGARSSDASVVAAGYDALRGVRDEVLASGTAGTSDARHLSMGMSGDLELAIACGATIVRIGTAVFGLR